MTLILTSEKVDEIIKDNILKILKKSQKNTKDWNYYFTPNIGISLYNPKVKYVDKKFIVFEFDRYKYSSLYHLIKHINISLQNELKTQYIELNDKNIYNIFSEEKETFFIRCYLPNNNGKYFITVNDDKRFYLPRIGCIYDNVVVEIRNLWGKDNKYGFNIELKNVNSFTT
jgi:hypothetical protein